MEKTLFEGKWFALIGDNGFGYTSSEAEIIEALRSLHRPSVIFLPNQDSARAYALNAYAARWFMRNGWMGQQITIPVNLPPDYLYLDPEYEAREGGRQLPYFPALLH